MSDSSNEDNFFDSGTFGDVEDLAMNESDEINLSDVGKVEEEANEVGDAQAINWNEDGAPVEDTFGNVDTNMVAVTDDSEDGDIDLLNLGTPEDSAADDSEFNVAEPLDDSDEEDVVPAVATAVEDDDSVDDMAAFNTSAIDDSADDVSGFSAPEDDESEEGGAAGINQLEEINAQSSDRVATISEPVATKPRVHKESTSRPDRPSRSLGRMLKIPAILAIIGGLGYGGFTMLNGDPGSDSKDDPQGKLADQKKPDTDSADKPDDNATKGDDNTKPNTQVAKVDPNSAAAFQKDLAEVKADTPDKAAQLAAISERLNQIDLDIVDRIDLEAIKSQVDELTNATNDAAVKSTIETIQLKLDYFMSILPENACDAHSNIRDEFGASVAISHPVVWLASALIGYDEQNSEDDLVKKIASSSKLATAKLEASKTATPQQARILLDEAIVALVEVQSLNKKLPAGAIKKLGDTYIEKTKKQVIAELQNVTLKLIDEKLTNAKDAAEAADLSKTNAKTAEDAAETSKTNAKTAEDAADKSKDNAASAEKAAEVSKDKADTAAKAAATSQTNAAAAEKAAAASQDNAKKAETAAVGSQNLAKKAELAAIDSQNKADQALASLLRSSISQLLASVNDRIKEASPQPGTAPSAELVKVENQVKSVQSQDLTKKPHGELLKALVALQDVEKQLVAIEKKSLVDKAKTLDPNALKAAIELVLKGEIEKGVLSDVSKLKDVNISDLVSREQAKKDAKEIAEDIVKTIKSAGGASPADLIKLKNTLEASLKKTLESQQKKTVEQAIAANRQSIINEARKGLTGGLSKEALMKINDAIKAATAQSANAEKIAIESNKTGANALKIAMQAATSSANAIDAAKTASDASKSAAEVAKTASDVSKNAAKVAKAAAEDVVEVKKDVTKVADRITDAETKLTALAPKIKNAEELAKKAETASGKAFDLAEATSTELTKAKSEYDEKLKDVYAKIEAAHSAPRQLSPSQLKELTGLVSGDVYKKLASWGYVPLEAPQDGPVVQQDADLARSLFQDGYNEMFSKTGSLDAARRLFAKAVQHDMQNPVYRYFLGLSMYCGDDAVGGMEQVRIGARLEKAQDSSRYVATRLERIQFKERKWLNRVRIEELSRRSP